MSDTVSDVMTPHVVTVKREQGFREVVRLIEEHRVHALPVVDDERHVLGVVAESDLLLKEELIDGRLRVPLPRRARSRLTGTTAGAVMTAPAVVIEPERSLGFAARTLRRRGIGRLPVVDEQRRLIGIVTRSDLLSVFLRSTDDLRAAVAEAIADVDDVPAGGITATVDDGVVVLRGSAQFLSQVMDVADHVRRVPGVVHLSIKATAAYDDIHAAMVGP